MGGPGTLVPFADPLLQHRHRFLAERIDAVPRASANRGATDSLSLLTRFALAWARGLWGVISPSPVSIHPALSHGGRGGGMRGWYIFGPSPPADGLGCRHGEALTIMFFRMFVC